MSWEPVEVPNPPPDNIDTEVFKFRLPDYGGDGSVWGYGLNGNWYALDIILAAIKATADAALPKTGGRMTGDIDFANPAEDNEETEEVDETQAAVLVGTATHPAGGMHTSMLSVHQPGDPELAGIDADGVATVVDITSTSDARLKSSIESLNKRELSRAVLALRPVSFRWLRNDKDDIGLIAQEVEALAPWAVFERDGYKRISYNKLMLGLVALLQEQNKQIESLRATVRGL